MVERKRMTRKAKENLIRLLALIMAGLMLLGSVAAVLFYIL